MPAADTRENAIPTASDMAFARGRRKAMLGPEEGDAPTTVPDTPTREGESTEIAQLRAELAELRKMIAAGQGRAPTDARRIGEAADAEMAAEQAAKALAELVDTTRLGEGVFEPKAGVTPKQVASAQEALKNATLQVDIARCLAGIIPKTHPGLRSLPPDHVVFRVR